MASEDTALLSEIRDYLKVIARMTANEATKGLTKTATVEALVELGLDTSTICELTGFPSSTVAPIVSKKRKSMGKK